MQIRLLTFALTTLVEDAAGRGFLSANITRRPSAITESHCSTLLRTSLSGPSHRALRARPDYPSGRDCTAAQHTKRQSRRKRQIAAATGRPCCADRADSETLHQRARWASWREVPLATVGRWCRLRCIVWHRPIVLACGEGALGRRLHRARRARWCRWRLRDGLC